jgi:cadmium resistance protein CadD (predicted permease)
MSKLRFFAFTIIILSLIQLAVSFGFVPEFYTGFWPLLSLIIGIAAFLISDKLAWDRTTGELKKSAAATRAVAKKTAALPKKRSHASRKK